MSKLRIEWLSDTSDCETCGPSWATGALVEFPNGELLRRIPKASCFGGDDWTQEEIYKDILEHLGYSVEEE